MDAPSGRQAPAPQLPQRRLDGFPLLAGAKNPLPPPCKLLEEAAEVGPVLQLPGNFRHRRARRVLMKRRELQACSAWLCLALLR